MWLDDLNALVEDLATSINTHRNILMNSESATRYALIDPLLNALGWRLSDPAQVRTEYSVETGRLDYAMWQGRKLCLVIEAKKLGASLDKNDRAIGQAIQYCYTATCRHLLVTDGDRWLGYDLLREGTFEEKCMLNFTVVDRRGIMDLFWLWPGNFEGETKQPNLHKRPVEETASRSTPQHVNAASGVPLPNAYVKGMEKPLRLVFPNGETKDLSKPNPWWRIQAATVEWLIDHNHVKDLPLQTEGGATLLKKTNRGSPLFRNPKEVRGYWIETHANANQHFTKAVQLLKSCGVDPTTVHVELS